MSKSERYRQIMEQTRTRFLQDTHIKMTELHTRFTHYFALPSPDEQDRAALVHHIHRHVHALKGLALTLSYIEMDAVCEDILHYILQDAPHSWELSDIEFLQQKIQQLNTLLEQASR